MVLGLFGNAHADNIGSATGKGFVNGTGVAAGKGIFKGQGTVSGKGIALYRDENGRVKYKKGRGTATCHRVRHSHW